MIGGFVPRLEFGYPSQFGQVRGLLLVARRHRVPPPSAGERQRLRLHDVLRARGHADLLEKVGHVRLEVARQILGQQAVRLVRGQRVRRVVVRRVEQGQRAYVRVHPGRRLVETLGQHDRRVAVPRQRLTLLRALTRPRGLRRATKIARLLGAIHKETTV